MFFSSNNNKTDQPKEHRLSRNFLKRAPKKSKMTPTIHCVRHAQGFHNLSVANHEMHDPLLTEFGQKQCHQLEKEFPYHNKVDLVVASPLKRTIYTALLGFSRELQEKEMQIIGLPELQETSDLPCDTGSSPAEIAREFQGKPVDLGLVAEGWNNKQGRWAAQIDAINRRAKDARKWLMARPERDIVVVTHGGFLHYFTEDWTGSDKFTGTGWANTEFRSYTFDTNNPDEAHLIETPESKQRRAGEYKPMDNEQTSTLTRTISREASERAQRDAVNASGIHTKVPN